MAGVSMANRCPARLRTKAGQGSVLLSGAWDWNKQLLKEAKVFLFLKLLLPLLKDPSIQVNLIV